MQQKNFQGSREPFHMQTLQFLQLFTMFRNISVNQIFETQSKY